MTSIIAILPLYNRSRLFQKMQKKEIQRIKSYDWYNEEPQNSVHSTVLLRPCRCGSSPSSLLSSLPLIAPSTGEENKVGVFSSTWVDSWKHLPSRKKEEEDLEDVHTLAREDWCLPVHLCQFQADAQSLEQRCREERAGVGPLSLGLTTKSRPQREAGMEAGAGWTSGLHQAALLSDAILGNQ